MASGLVGRDKFNYYLFIIVLVLLLCILPGGFIHEKTGRVIFYYCSYFSVVGVAVNYREFRSVCRASCYALPLFALATLYAIWSLFAYYSLHYQTAEWLLFTPAKRWFLAGVIALYVCWGCQKGILRSITIKRWAMISLAAAFVLSSAYAVWQGFTSQDRIILGINRATMTAYAYSALSLALMTLIARHSTSSKKYLALLLMGLLSVAVIFLTETRSAMALHIFLAVLLVLASLWQDKKLTPMSLGALLLLLLVVAGVGSRWSMVKMRVDSTFDEIHLYQQGNDRTSLGSRFTMWKMGIMTFKEAPFGETEITRNARIRAYLDSHNQQNSWALEYIDVHLHNEFIQNASLSGIFGILTLLFFFGRLIFRNGISGLLLNPVSVVTLSALLYGMTDVVLNSVEYIVLLTSVILLSWLSCISSTDEKVAG